MLPSCTPVARGQTAIRTVSSLEDPYREPDFAALGASREWLESIRPGAFHDRLGFLVGRFVARGSMSPGSGAETRSLTGEIDSKWILGGRFVESRGLYTYEGQPIDGREVFGFDAVAHRYFNFNIDNWRTGPLIKTGRFSEDTGGITLQYELRYAELPDARQIIDRIFPTGPDSYVLEAWELLANGQLERRSRIEYTRAKVRPAGDPVEGDRQ